MMAFTREPSGKRASTIGQTSSTRRPTFDTMRSMICIKWALSRNSTGDLFHPAAAFHVNVLGAVDQNIADRLILEQHFERAEAERLVEHFFDQPLALGAIEERFFGVAQVLDHQANLAAQHVALQIAHAREVELVDELVVNPPLELIEFFGLGGIGTGGIGEWLHRDPRSGANIPGADLQSRQSKPRSRTGRVVKTRHQKRGEDGADVPVVAKKQVKEPRLIATQALIATFLLRRTVPLPNFAQS